MKKQAKAYNPIYRVISKWSPSLVFFADACGALFTTLTHCLILVQFHRYLGLSKQIIYLLASVAALLFLYSISMYAIKPRSSGPFLKVISVANTLYCLLTLGLLFQFRGGVTALAWLYFAGEIVIITCIALAEWTYAKNHFGQNSNPYKNPIL